MPSSLRIGNVRGKERVEPVVGSKAWLERAARKDRPWRVWRKVRYGRFGNFVDGVWRRFTSWGFFRTFFGFRWTTQVILLFMFVSGSILLVEVYATDLGMDLRPIWLHRYDAAWLRGHAYIPSLLAGFTGFLIGAPVGAVILSHFTTEREEKVAINRVNGLSSLAWYAFRDAVYKFASAARIDALQNTAHPVAKAYDDAFTALEEYISCRAEHEKHRRFKYGDLLWNRLNKLQSQRDSVEKLKRLDKAVGNAPWNIRHLEDRLMQRTIGGSFGVKREWATVQGAWNTLDQYVRLQRQEQNLEWFDPERDANIRTWMSATKSALQEFTDLYQTFGGESEDYEQTTTMGVLQKLVSARNNDIIEVRRSLSQIKTAAGYSPVIKYNARLRAAASVLISLQGAVNDVEIANWPESASKPARTHRANFQDLGTANARRSSDTKGQSALRGHRQKGSV